MVPHRCWRPRVPCVVQTLFCEPCVRRASDQTIRSTASRPGRMEHLPGAVHPLSPQGTPGRPATQVRQPLAANRRHARHVQVDYAIVETYCHLCACVCSCCVHMSCLYLFLLKFLCCVPVFPVMLFVGSTVPLGKRCSTKDTWPPCDAQAPHCIT